MSLGSNYFPEILTLSNGTRNGGALLESLRFIFKADKTSICNTWRSFPSKVRTVQVLSAHFQMYKRNCQLELAVCYICRKRDSKSLYLLTIGSWVSVCRDQWRCKSCLLRLFSLADTLLLLNSHARSTSDFLSDSLASIIHFNNAVTFAYQC